MQRPIVSVIIPVFDREEYVEEAIYSILDQTLQDFEIIVVDDASTDNSLRQIKNIDDERIIILENKKHVGVSLSRNRALKLARGKYIAYMDSDDISHSTRLERQVDYLQSNPNIKACGCWLQCFGKLTNVIKHKEDHNKIQAELLLKNSMSLGATTIEKAAFDGIYFDESKINVEDYEYWVQAAWKCRLTNLQEILYYYRTHEKQVSTLYLDIQREQDIEIKLDLLKKIDEELIEENKSKITEVLFSKRPLEIKSYHFYFNLLKLLQERNKFSRAFNQRELKEIMLIIRRNFVFDIYFKSYRQLTKEDRLQIFKILPWADKIFVLKRKFREKYKLLIKDF